MSRSSSAPVGTVRRKGTRTSLAAAVAAVLAAQSAFAADLTWNNSGPTDNWNTADLNWGAGAWSNATPDSAFFGGTGITGETITLGAPIIAGALTFNSNGYSIGNGGTAANTLSVGGTAPTITVTNATDTATISAVITGTGFTKSGAGILTLSGVNTYTGATTVTGGTLSIAADTALGATSGALTLDGGTLKITAGGQTLNAAREVKLGAAGGTIDTSSITGSNISTTVAGVISGTGPLTLKSTGNMTSTGGGDSGVGIKLGNTNTFTGDVTITNGLVSYASNSSFGNAANKIILNGGGLLDNNASIPLSRDIQVLAGGGTFRTWGSVNVAWTGAITGSGNINRTDGGTLNLSGDLSGYTGTYNNQGGNTNLTGTVATIGGNWTISAGTLMVNSPANQTLSGVISGAGAFTKTGPGTLTLSGTNTQTGATAVNGGVLNVAGSLTSAVTVNSAGVLNLAGTLTSGVTVNSGGILTGTGSTTGTITFNNGSGILINSGGAVQGNITANATTNIFVGGAPTNSLVTADVIRYTGTAPTLSNFSAATNYRSGLLVNDPTNKKITLAYQTEAKTWKGTAGGTWDTGSSTSWNGGDSKFYWGDSVAFGDTAANQSVTLTGRLAPSSITVSNSANTYTFSGGGAIIGAGSLTKSGNGTLIIANAAGSNTYSGGTFVNGGTLQLGDGTVQATLTGGYAIASGATLRIQNNVLGSSTPNWANFSGAGTLALGTGRNADTGWNTAALTNNFTGTLQIEGGRVITTTAADNGLGGTTNVVVKPGGHLGMWNGGTFNQSFTIAGTGYGENGYESALRLANSGITTTVNGTVTLAGNATLGATGTAILNNTISGASTSALTFGTGSQAGTVTLRGANTYSGNTIVNFGTLALDYSAQDNSKLSDSGALILGDGTTLQLAGASGSHTEVVGSVIVNGGASITRNGNNTARIALNNIAGTGILNVASAGLATTNVANNTSGYLDNVLFGGNQFAMNDGTGGAGNIVAATGVTYTDVARLTGSKVISNSPGAIVRVIDGSTGTAANITAAGSNDIGTLFQTATGGAATVDLTAGTLRLGANGRILSAPGASALTIQNGTLTAGGATDASGTLSIQNGSTNAITVNTQITDNGAGSVGLRTVGNVVLGVANSYTGGTVINSGQLQIRNVNALGSGSVTVNSGGVLGFGPSGMTVSKDITLNGGTLSGGLDSGTVNNTYSGTLTLGAAGGTVLTWWSDKTLTITGKITGSGALTVDRQLAANNPPVIVMSGANDYTGDTMINAGTVTVSGTGVLGGGAYSGKITNNGTLNWNSTTAQAFSGQLSGSGIYNINAGSTTLSGTASISGELRINPSAAGTTMAVTGGTYNIANFSLFQNSINNSTATYNQSGGAVNVAGIFQLGASTAGGSSNDINIANFTGGTLTAGTVQLYKWANSQLNISGNANVTAGVLQIGWSDSSPTGTITVGNGSKGGLLAWGDTTLGNNRSYTLNLDGGTIKATKSNASWIQAGAFATMAVKDGGGTIDNGGSNVTVGQVISHGGTNPTDGGLNFAGVGMSTLTAANTYVGPTIVGEGTLAITGSIAGSTEVDVKNNAKLILGGTSLDRIGNLALFSLGGGTASGPATLQLDNSAGQISESVGALSLASTAVLDLGTGSAGSAFHFADSSAQAWTGTLSIYNWSSNSDHLFFGNSLAGLTSTQLSSIIFYSDAGSTSLGAATFVGGGEIAPVPEPSALAMGVGMLGYLFSRRRRASR